MYSVAMYRVLCILFAVFISSSAFAQTKTVKDDFVSGFEDLPLMTGLIQLEDGAVSFDSPSGRIVEAYAESPTLTIEKILTFYSDALPQLGWKKDGETAKKNMLVFTRDGEILKISLEKNTSVAVRFELTSQQ